MLKGETVLSVMDRNRGSGPGFDWVRIGLSLAVILLHSFHTSYGYRFTRSLSDGLTGPFFAAILPILISADLSCVVAGHEGIPAYQLVATRRLQLRALPSRLSRAAGTGGAVRLEPRMV
jgi:hypothetical protein